MNIKILTVEDDPSIREIIKVYLKGEGFEVLEATNGKEALSIIDDSISLVILDIMMPEMDGMEACLRIREKYQMPVLFLTAKTEDMDKVDGLSIGGDDYITKPFIPMELVARVKANLRRYTVYSPEDTDETKGKRIISLRGLDIDIPAHKVTKNGEEIQLTPTEFSILELLASHRGRVFSLEQIYTNVWKEECIMNSGNTVSVHIKKLRGKIEDDIKHPEYIKTVWGVGYRID